LNTGVAVSRVVDLDDHWLAKSCLACAVSTISKQDARTRLPGSQHQLQPQIVARAVHTKVCIRVRFPVIFLTGTPFKVDSNVLVEFADSALDGFLVNHLEDFCAII
jgi:hypothetical protein